MQLFRIGLLHTQGEIHLGFTVEEKARDWIASNNQLALLYSGLPLYCFLGAL